jgi:hypothetical protein
MPPGEALLLNAAPLAGEEEEHTELSQGKWWRDTENLIRESVIGGRPVLLVVTNRLRAVAVLPAY